MLPDSFNFTIRNRNVVFTALRLSKREYQIVSEFGKVNCHLKLLNEFIKIGDWKIIDGNTLNKSVVNR